MRLATYKGSDGSGRSAVVVSRNGADEVIDLEEASGGKLHHSLIHVLRGGDAALDQVRQIAGSSAAGKPVASVQLLAPLPRPGKIICIAGNFQKHIEEGGGKRVNKDIITPKLFIKPSSAVIGPGEALTLPPVAENSTDWELELGIVMGKRGRDIPIERALDYVAGYTVFNDVSGRSMDWNVEGRNPSDWDSFFDWLNGKWIDGFAAFGPWITTADEVADPDNLDMELQVNGKVWQKGSTADMIFNPAEIISFASQFMTWEPGDIIAGGTLDGTGDAAGVYVKAGDVMSGTVGNLGTLVTPVAARTSPTGLNWRSKAAARA
jgi:2-keto-4-pentenoate hydratase/2-oxohepta-3-ene-1,7-dioic acid hydratase in catechol pathway